MDEALIEPFGANLGSGWVTRNAEVPKNEKTGAISESPTNR